MPKILERDNLREVPRAVLGLGWAAIDMVIVPAIKKIGSLGVRSEPYAPPARITYYRSADHGAGHAESEL